MTIYAVRISGRTYRRCAPDDHGAEALLVWGSCRPELWRVPRAGEKFDTTVSGCVVWAVCPARRGGV
jgi:hypothetical protein